MENILFKIHRTTVSLLDKRIEESANAMIIAPTTKDHGGIPWEGSGLTHISWHDRGSVNFIPRAVALWMEPESKFYRSRELLNKIEMAIEFVEKNLPKSGLVSMVYCNFSSPPDTGFAMFCYGPVLESLRKQTAPEMQSIRSRFEALTERLGSALVGAGIHTPNHRWSHVQSLGWMWRLFQNDAAKADAEKWLAEGIDTTADGEYMERSTNYSNHSNRSLISAAYTLERPDLIEAPRKNLANLPYLVHADDNCVTDYSGRNDFGLDVHISRFLESVYLYHAMEPSRFSAMLVEKCAKEFVQSGQDDETYILPASIDLLPWIQLFPPEKLEWPQPETWPKNYIKLFRDEKTQSERIDLSKNLALPYNHNLSDSVSHPSHGAPFVRIRRDEFSATIMSHSPSLASMRLGDVRLSGLYFNLSYFGAGAVPAFDLEQKNEMWILSHENLKATYFKSLPDKISSLNMNYENRERTDDNHLKWSAEIEEIKNGLRFHFQSTGAIESGGDEVPVLGQIVLQFPASGELGGKNLWPADKLPDPKRPGYIRDTGADDFYLTEGEAFYMNGRNKIVVEGGAMQHTLRLMLGDKLSRDFLSLRINLVLPGEHELKIWCE